MSAWTVVVVEQSQSSQLLSSPSQTTLTYSSFADPPTFYKDLVQQDLTNVKDLLDGQIFFSAPFGYLGNHVTSYGGYVKYSLLYVRGDDGKRLSVSVNIIQ